MVELKEWQRVAGKVTVKENERYFVLNDGTVIATDVTNKKFGEYAKERQIEKAKRRQKNVDKKVSISLKKLDKIQKVEDELKKRKEALMKQL